MAKSIPIVGKAFPTLEGFQAYLKTIRRPGWMQFITMHHCGSPDLAIWKGYQTRKVPISVEQWLRNLGEYYAKPVPGVKGAWSAGPQFFFTYDPSFYCVLSLPEKIGVHAQSFNDKSWGVECVGNFDKPWKKGMETDAGKFTGKLRDWYIDGFAALHLAAGLQPGGFVRGKSGLHFHRDDPKTSKTCPGDTITKDDVVAGIQKAMSRISGAPVKVEAPKVPDKELQPPIPVAVAKPAIGVGIVKGVATNDVLNVRAGASARDPVVTTLKNGASVQIVGEMKNGPTVWYEIDIPGDANGFVSAAYIEKPGKEATPAVVKLIESPTPSTPINRKIIVDFMVGKGWKDVHGYGAAANIYQECSFIPNLVGDRGSAYGLCQWHGDRQALFRKQFGKSIKSATAMEQLAFMHWELTNTEKGAGDKLRATTTAKAAGAAFSRWYERPKAVEKEMTNRGTNAQKWFDEDEAAKKRPVT